MTRNSIQVASFRWNTEQIYIYQGAIGLPENNYTVYSDKTYLFDMVLNENEQWEEVGKGVTKRAGEIGERMAKQLD